PAFEGKLNRAVGLGSHGPLEEADVRELELAFATIGLGPEIHPSPLASFDSTALIFRGYTESAVLSTYWCTIQNNKWAMGAVQHLPGDMAVRLAEPHETKKFIEASIEGFHDNGRSRELLGTLAELAIQREDVLFFAEVNGQIAGTAAMATMNTLDGPVAHFYLDSTIAKFRGQGIQLALIRARLRTAHQLGYFMATSTTRVGDGSGRNAERAGLSVAYTTPILQGPRTS
ncbi:hypothetical protein N7466_005401, partial [Penicillium verhagenii]|uniref:uncharacterized protein n=1 Tax=Penicillium verhagenii TaxID=1562060 RepID=UPI002545137B